MCVLNPVINPFQLKPARADFIFCHCPAWLGATRYIYTEEITLMKLKIIFLENLCLGVFLIFFFWANSSLGSNILLFLGESPLLQSVWEGLMLHSGLDDKELSYCSHSDGSGVGMWPNWTNKNDLLGILLELLRKKFVFVTHPSVGKTKLASGRKLAWEWNQQRRQSWEGKEGTAGSSPYWSSWTRSCLWWLCNNRPQLHSLLCLNGLELCFCHYTPKEYWITWFNEI